MTHEDKSSSQSERKSTLNLLAHIGTRNDRLSLRRRLYDIIEVGRGEDQASRIIDNFLILLIILNVLAFTLETVPEIEKEYGTYLFWFNVASVLVFTVEYFVRIWTSVEVPFLRNLPPWKARLQFARRPYLIIDLLAILPFYLSFLFAVDLRILRVLRLFRFLKIARYSPALHTLIRVLFNERRALMGALLVVIAVLLFSATGIYFIEGKVNPDNFGSIPQSAWWAMATLTTVGYGDVYPITPLGKVFGGIIMIFGLAMFALPIAIISTGFAQETSRRDFVVTWSLIARIPILAELDASEVAGLMNYLHAHNYPQHWEVVAAGSEGDAMYFIAAGQVMLKTDAGIVILKTGDFFGEIAMLENTNYEFPYTTLTPCKLLKLHKTDFAQLCHAHPQICDHIKRVAAQRQEAREKGKIDPVSTS